MFTDMFFVFFDFLRKLKENREMSVKMFTKYRPEYYFFVYYDSPYFEGLQAAWPPEGSRHTLSIIN